MGDVDYVYAHYKIATIKNCWTCSNITIEKANETEYSVDTVLGCGTKEEIANCYYANEQLFTAEDINITFTGSLATLNDFQNPDFYKNRLKWDENIWNITNGAYPTLK